MEASDYWEENTVAKKLGPLGLLPVNQKGVPAQARAKLEILERIDLTSEKRSLVHHIPSLSLFIDVLERELKRFLSLPVLVSEPDYNFVPSLLVDELWHNLILNTRKYRSMCDDVYGAYLDHNPNPEGYAKELAHTSGEIAEYTRATLTKYYGSLVRTIWGTDVMRPCVPDIVPEPPPPPPPPPEPPPPPPPPE